MGAAFLPRWAPLKAMAKFGAPTTVIQLPAKVLVGSERGGEKSVHGDGGDRVTELTKKN
jgi:hypothetical protein